MSPVNKVEVKIHGKEYTLRGEEPGEYLQKVAHYVDKKMADISIESTRMSTAQTAVLTCINVADEYFKLLDSVSGIQDELEKKKKEAESYQEEINKLMQKNTQIQLDLAKIKSEMENKKKIS